MNELPAPERLLNDVGMSLSWDFQEYFYNRRCTCHKTPICGFCAHPGNPMNLEESEDVWDESMQLNTLNDTFHGFIYIVGYFSGTQQEEMTKWLLETYGECSYEWVYVENSRWYRGSHHYVFKTEAERNWFLMRWS